MNNILVTSAGRRVSLIRAFQKEAGKYSKIISVFAGDANAKYSAACNIADKSFSVPRLDDPGYMDYLEKICLQEKIGLVIPTIDTELLLLSENKERFYKRGINVVISDLDFIKKCRDKRKTHKLFNKLNINTPRLFDKKSHAFPIIIKPYDGSNSSEIYIINKQSELTDYHYQNEKLIFFEYLDHNKHTEFTVDLYFDKYSELKCIIPRERIEVRGGEVNKGITRKNDILRYLKERINYLEGARGCITLQLFQNKQTEELYGIEINPRFGGGYPLTYEAGGNFPKWIIDEYLFNRTIEEFDGWEDNLLMLRYDDEVLVRNYEE